MKFGNFCILFSPLTQHLLEIINMDIIYMKNTGSSIFFMLNYNITLWKASAALKTV